MASRSSPTAAFIAATENDTVYVMAARTGRILWSRHLAKPVPSSDLPCGDISPEVGITGTPVIDLKRNEIFVDADTLVRGPSASRGVEASHRLIGLNLSTGEVELDERAMPSAGEDQLAQLQRPGLALDHGLVVIAYGQNTGDCPGPNGPAHGFIVSIPEQGGRLHYFQIGRGRDRGAVWMGGSSPVVDPHGNVYVASVDGYNLGGPALRRQRRCARAVVDHAPQVDLPPQGLRIHLTDSKQEAAVIDAIQRERTDEYHEVVGSTRQFHEELQHERRRGRTTYTELEESDADLVRHQKWLAAIRGSHDFDAPGGQEAVAAVASCEEALARFESEALSAELGESAPDSRPGLRAVEGPNH